MDDAAPGQVPHRQPPHRRPPYREPPYDTGGDAGGRMAGYLRWWALGMVVLVGIAVAAALTGGGDGERTAVPGSEATASARLDAGTAGPTTPGPTPGSGSPGDPASPEEHSGSGATVVTLTATDARVVRLTHAGSGNFAVWSVDDEGRDVGLLANVIGAYSGAHPLNLLDDEQAAALRIEADGEWTVTSAPLAAAPSWDGTGTYSADGADVVRVEGAAEGLTPVTLAHQGEGNFTVWGHGEFPSLLVNEIGSYTGETLLPAGTLVLAVDADGPWTIARS